MACNRSSTALPLSCQQLALAKQQLALYQSGQMVAAIETPGLGRVEYAKTDPAELQKLIDRLAAQCAADCGATSTASMLRRRPISIEACP